jgi:hypothetical protein
VLNESTFLERIIVHLIRRYEKLRRLLRWRLASGMPLWWHVGRPNFGDDINPSLFRRLAGCRTRFAANRRRPHVLGAGSILGKATASSIVCGSGFLEPPGRDRIAPAAVVAVRGELSRSGLGGRSDVALGDPLVLVGELLAPQTKRHRFGLVPHVTSVDRWRSRCDPDLLVIAPGLRPWRVIRGIASCETIISQSLHGLIVADALGIPNVWIAPSDAMVGGRFKFDDYFSTIDRPKECVPECGEVFQRPGVLAAGVGTYRHAKEELREALVNGCRRLID